MAHRTNYPWKSTDVDPFSKALLSAMLAFREGNFSVRLPSDITGVNGKIADAFNDIAATSESRARETVTGGRIRSGRKASSSNA